MNNLFDIQFKKFYKHVFRDEIEKENINNEISEKNLEEIVIDAF